MNRADLRPFAEILVVQQGAEQREYRFVETSFEQKSLSSVAPAVFEPEAILLGSATAPAGKDESAPSATTPPAAMPLVASRELEVEVLRLLNQAGADLGEQVSVVRAPEGYLRVQAIVDSEKRKSELQNALASVKGNPAVKLDIATRAEVVNRQQQRGSKPQSVTVEETARGASSIPVDADLRRYFTASGLSGEQLELNIRRFSNRTLNRSLQMMQHAWALKRLAERFSPDELQALDAEARSKWLSMIRGHARSLQQQILVLQRELAPVFGGAGGEAHGSPAIGSDRELVEATQRLFPFCSENDRVIGAALT
ncbi:MAG: hypothetical protein ACRD8U_10180, partial [Pyrinomonadaceae bacterium]